MRTWQIVIGTVGFGAVLWAAVAWALLTAARLLEDEADVESTVVRVDPWPTRGPVASDGGWGDAGHLRAMRAEQHRRELRARVHASTKTRGPERPFVSCASGVAW